MADQEGVGAVFAIGVDRHEDATVVSFSGELDVLAQYERHPFGPRPAECIGGAGRPEPGHVPRFKCPRHTRGRLPAGLGRRWFVFCALQRGHRRRVLEISGLLEYLNVGAEPPAALCARRLEMTAGVTLTVAICWCGKLGGHTGRRRSARLSLRRSSSLSPTTRFT